MEWDMKNSGGVGAQVTKLLQWTGITGCSLVSALCVTAHERGKSKQAKEGWSFGEGFICMEIRTGKLLGVICHEGSSFVSVCTLCLDQAHRLKALSVPGLFSPTTGLPWLGC